MTRHGRSDKAASFRRLRVGEALRHALVEVLAQGNLRHPDLENVSITVSEVRVSPDLRNATVFVMPLGGGAIEAVLEGLGRAAPYLRAQVARIVKLRYMPALGFEAEIPTLDGDPAALKVPAGTQSGRVFTIRRKGIPRLHGGGRGDFG